MSLTKGVDMFDKSVVIQLEQDVGKDTLLQLFDVFRQESTKLVNELMACDTIDDDAIRLSHSLKSCSRSYGANQLATLAESIEKAARDKDISFFELRMSLPEVHSITINNIPIP